MTGAEIHNGVVLADVPGVGTGSEPSPAPKPDPMAEDKDPEVIAQQMAWTISTGVAEGQTPMEIVNRLLALKSPKGHKLVWTRFDMLKLYAMYSNKLTGENRL